MKSELLSLIHTFATPQQSPEEQIRGALAVLSERERAVLELRFGLKGEQGYTLQAVGELFGVTGERVRQIEARALGKLRRVALVQLRQDRPPVDHRLEVGHQPG